MRRAALILASAAGAAAWSCDGHMAVAQIALDSGIMSSATIASANKRACGSFSPFLLLSLVNRCLHCYRTQPAVIVSRWAQ